MSGKVLILNGSPRTGGNTSIAIREMTEAFQEEGIKVETVQVGNKPVRGCIDRCRSVLQNEKI